MVCATDHHLCKKLEAYICVCIYATHTTMYVYNTSMAIHIWKEISVLQIIYTINSSH
jgi:hypothetical protein